MYVFRCIVAASLIAFPSYCFSKDISGVWQTQPDRKDLISHIKIEVCEEEQGYCGTVLRAFDETGQEVQTPNIGRRLFWGMTEQSDGVYAGGAFYLPLIDMVTENITFRLEGDILTVSGRVAMIRSSQEWTRLE